MTCTDPNHMEMPCVCEECDTWFDLNDGVGCEDCKNIFCQVCVEDHGARQLCGGCTEVRGPWVAMIDASHTVSGRGGTKYHAIKDEAAACCGSLVWDDNGDYASRVPEYMQCQR